MSDLSLSLPNYDSDEYKKKYRELSYYESNLPPDLSVVGYVGINRLFSEIQEKLNRLNRIKNDAMADLSAAEAIEEAYKSDYEAKYSALFSSLNKEGFGSAKAIENRVASDLADEKKSWHRAKIVAGLIKAYYRTVCSVYSNLESTKKTLEQQTNNYKRLNPMPANPNWQQDHMQPHSPAPANSQPIRVGGQRVG